MTIGIVGLGYVGLPLAVAFCEVGQEVVGVDTDVRVVEALGRGESHVEDVPADSLRAVADRFQVSTRYANLAKVDAVVVAVPTPLTRNREPDLGPLVAAGTALAGVLQQDQLVVLESTTYAGTTRERFVPLLEESGMAAGKDFYAAFSPERTDLGRTDFTLRTTPQDRGRPDRRVPAARRRAVRPRLRRARAGVDAGGRGAQQAARERLPLGEHRSRQRAGDPPRPDGHRRLGGGRGGGHQAVRVHVVQARPGDGRTLPPRRSVLPRVAGARVRHPDRVHRARRRGEPADALLLRREDHTGAQRPLQAGARLTGAIVGVSYKPGVGGLRESPALKIIRLLREQGAEVTYHDDFVPELPELALRLEWPEDADSP